MSEKLTPQQIQAAQMLATGRNTFDITRKVQICEDTLHNAAGESKVETPNAVTDLSPHEHAPQS